MKTRQRILIGLFLFLLTGPMIIFPFVRNRLDTENRENRPLVTLAEVAEAPWWYKPRAFQEFFNDHLPFKNQMVAAHSLIFAANPMVVTGEDGWLFFRNIGAADNPIDDITGANSYTGAEIAAAAENVLACKTRLADRGIKFHLIIPPNKESVYTEYLPEYLRTRAVSRTRTDALVNGLLSRGVELVYPKNLLLEAKWDGFCPYYKYDTHWSFTGGYTAAIPLFRDMGISLPPLGSYRLSEVSAPADLADLAGFRPDAGAAYWPEGFGGGASYKTEEIAAGHFLYTSDAADPRTVLVFGDSYFASLAPYFALSFQSVIEINRSAADYDPDALIALYQPDAVICEVVERSSDILLKEDILKPAG